MLESERVFIRLIEREDLVFRTEWINDEEVAQTLMFDWPLSLAGTHKWFEQQLLDNTRKNFVIIDKSSDTPIGITGLRDINYRHLRAQFYMTIGNKDFWGKRIPDEVIPIVLEYAFEELALNRVYLYTLDNNERARRVYERNGFIQEGILHNHFFCRGAYRDLWVMAFLRRQWLGRKR